MDYIVEVQTTDGKICERFRSYARARRRVDELPAADRAVLERAARLLQGMSAR